MIHLAKHLPAALACLLCVPLLQGGGDDPAKDLRSSDAAVRLAAAKEIIAAPPEDAEKLLVKALKDEDWEVVAVAAGGLRDVGGKASIKPLTSLAWDGPVARVRIAAAESLAALDPEAAVKGISRKLSGKDAARACDALVLVALGAEEIDPPKALRKLLRGKETLVRAAAARALIVCEREDRAAVAAELFASPHVAVAAAALEGAALDPRFEQLPPLMDLLLRETLDDVLERRGLRAVVASAGAAGEERREEELLSRIAQLCGSTPAKVAARGPRLAEAATRAGWFDAGKLLATTGPAREHDGEGVRAAAARALRFAGGGESLAEARRLAAEDAHPRVRRAALASALALEPVAEEAQLAWILERLEGESDLPVREALFVALGEPELEGGISALIEGVEAARWETVVCAAVSLGRTRSERAVAPLQGLYREGPGWQHRGAAVVALTHCLQKDGVGTLIEALADDEPLIVRTAHGYLLSIARGEVFPPDVEPWRAWWAENRDSVRLFDPEELKRRREKYGYTVPDAQIYQGLDVLVLQSRGDHIEEVLTELEIEHRLTESSRVAADGLDAAGVFVANCTGEIEQGDVERLAWFVRAGGYLFGSCWAVHETIERIAPGAVRKLETRDEVLDQVTATPCSPDSPWLEGVFGEGVQPIYHLYGAHLIEVLEPERVEVLIDSAESAEEWGGGNLACWFPVGHGVILDSVNHFDLQGLEEAVGLKSREDRMAYAVDHLGLDLSRLRETFDAKFWDSSHKASQEVRDLSVFRLITNFVRARRIAGR